MNPELDFGARLQPPSDASAEIKAFVTELDQTLTPPSDIFSLPDNFPGSLPTHTDFAKALTLPTDSKRKTGTNC